MNGITNGCGDELCAKVQALAAQVDICTVKLGGSIYSILDYTNTTLKIYERKLKFCMSKNIGKICSKAKFQA